MDQRAARRAARRRGRTGARAVPGYLDDAARTLAADWDARAGRRAILLAAARHAVDFQTWRSLARDGGLDRADVVELASALVGRAAGR